MNEEHLLNKLSKANAEGRVKEDISTYPDENDAEKSGGEGNSEGYSSSIGSLKEELSILYNLLEHTESLFLLLEKNGVIKYVNNKTCETLGFKKKICWGATGSTV